MKTDFKFKSTISLFVIVAMSAVAVAMGGLEPTASVSGSGERDGITLTIGAVQHSDNPSDVTGNATFHNRNNNSKLSLDITGISILLDDRLASVKAEVTRSTGAYALSFPVGTTVSFQVEDEGEGADALPDGFTLPVGKKGTGDPAPPACKDDCGILPASERGNFQVRGEKSASGIEVPPKG